MSKKLDEKHVKIVSYEKQGYCIAAQGSEMCHQVTAVEKSKEDRISFVVSMMPANVYQRDRFVYQVPLARHITQLNVLFFIRR